MDYSEALYSERRNAIPIWQGYHYQGEVALRRYLEIIGQIFVSCKDIEQGKQRCQEVQLRIEWLEDFVIYKTGEISEIYQVKKTLNKSNRDEVIGNFILQYKLFGKNDIQWNLNCDKMNGPHLDKLSEKEFDDIYKTAIEENFVTEINSLKSNRDSVFWREQLNQNNRDSKCKHIRGFLGKLLEKDNVQYSTSTEIDYICDHYLKLVLQKCSKRPDDYTQFISQIHISIIDRQNIAADCEQYIQDIPQEIRCNQTLSSEDIYEKLICEIYKMLSEIEDKSKEKFEVSFSDIEKICRDTENTKYKWIYLLEQTRIQLLELINKYYCSKCSTGAMGLADACDSCVFPKLEIVKMDELIDNMSLDRPLFCDENALDSITNKISKDKLNLISRAMNKFRSECAVEAAGRISVKNKEYFLSDVSGTQEQDESLRDDILENYWAHNQIYRDYNKILTRHFDYELTEENISFLKEKPEASEEEKIVTFFDTRKTKFFDYEKVKI